MGAHQNTVQGTVVFGIAVISTLLYGAFDALVCMTVHKKNLLLFGTGLVWTKPGNPFRKNLLILLFVTDCDIVVSR